MVQRGPHHVLRMARLESPNLEPFLKHNKDSPVKAVIQLASALLTEGFLLLSQYTSRFTLQPKPHTLNPVLKPVLTC